MPMFQSWSNSDCKLQKDKNIYVRIARTAKYGREYLMSVTVLSTPVTLRKIIPMYSTYLCLVLLFHLKGDRQVPVVFSTQVYAVYRRWVSTIAPLFPILCSNILSPIKEKDVSHYLVQKSPEAAATCRPGTLF